MKLLLTNKEISSFLIETFNWKEELEKSGVYYSDSNVKQFLKDLHPKMLEPRSKQKLIDKLQNAVSKDLKEYVDRVNENLKNLKDKKSNLIYSNIEYILSKINKQSLFLSYKKHKYKDFVKGTGLSISSKAVPIRRKDFTDYSQDCLFRNMQGNEDLLLTKIKNRWPFWFIDTGYTNFLNGKKKIWHRLTRNHLHQINNFSAPADRLGNFEFFPMPWRTSGEKILIIEPGSFSANTFGIDIKQWKLDVETELRQYTDKPIVFREKLTKKKRKSLFKELTNEDYYCVININSNAAVESIWAGIPVITLSEHISNPVTRNKLSDINNLYRPNIAEWLCVLSYSQFTYEELINGTAYSIMKRYHNV